MYQPYIKLCRVSGFGILLVKITAGMCRPIVLCCLPYSCCSETNSVVNNVLYHKSSELLVVAI